jgi:uncharacterized membrane protein
MKIILFKIVATVFVLAGVNHFLSPEFYLPLIPDYLPFPQCINWFSGVLEIIIGLAIWTPQYRRIGGWALSVLMVLFIPAHVHFIHIGHCLPDGLCVDPWIGWGRLIVIQPLFIYLGIAIARSSAN